MCLSRVPGILTCLCACCAVVFCACQSVIIKALACALQVQYWAPAAAAAGVSLVMAYLNGVAIPDLLSLHTLIAKWVGTCCSVGANLALGPEAPMVGPSHLHTLLIAFDVVQASSVGTKESKK